ncbi:MAG: hypothetical protein PVI93_23305, partial [Desulfobacterales bacterium]
MLIFALQGCVADQPQLQNQNTRLQDEVKHLQQQLYEAEQQINSQKAEIARLQEAETAGNRNLKDLKAKNASLKNLNLKLTDEVERLTIALGKNKSVIKLQNKVIGLLDDTKKTIATSLKDEIAAQQIELVET